MIDSFYLQEDNKAESDDVKPESTGLNDLDPSKVSLRDSDSFMSDWYSSLSNDGDKSGTDSKETVKLESPLKSSTSEVQESSETAAPVTNESVDDENLTQTTDEDGTAKEKKVENDPDAISSEFYIVREQPHTLQYALKEYQLIVCIYIFKMIPFNVYIYC